MRNWPRLTGYPDGNGFALKSLLVEKCRVDLNQVTLGNGSNDILELVGQHLLGARPECGVQ